MKPPAFQFYAADFLVGTSTMTNEEVGIYIRMLCHQWDRGFVPADKAARLVRAEIPPEVLTKFTESNGELRNERLESERKKQAEFREQQSQRGKAGAAAKWGVARDGTRHASAIGQTMAPPSSGQWPNDGSSSSSSSSAFSLQTSSSVEAQGAAVAADHDGKRKRKTDRAPFVPPTIDEVTAYCRERQNSVDPQRFIDHYTSNGWRVGKNPMRDWRASIRTWEKNEHAAQSPSTQPRNRSEQRLNGSLGAIANVVQSGGLRPSNGDTRRLETHG